MTDVLLQIRRFYSVRFRPCRHITIENTESIIIVNETTLNKPFDNNIGNEINITEFNSRHCAQQLKLYFLYIHPL